MGRAPRSEKNAESRRAPVTWRIPDSQGGHLIARRAQNSEKGAKQPAGNRVDKRVPSNQKCVCCLPSRRAPSGQDDADSQEGTECP